ncbi:hypothetical protein [Lysinibacillus sp. FSL K6-0102]|uniref:hypothetical protein n=1 Tax=Lysinibacillus sp. FSL K6-0102 TaxID=2975290 RepID=UPI0030F750A1
MNIVTFNGLLTDEQLKLVEKMLEENGKLEKTKINNKIFEYPVFKPIQQGHKELCNLNSFKISVLLQKVELATLNIGSGLDFKTGLHLTNYLNLLYK